MQAAFRGSSEGQVQHSPEQVFEAVMKPGTPKVSSVPAQGGPSHLLLVG